MTDRKQKSVCDGDYTSSIRFTFYHSSLTENARLGAASFFSFFVHKGGAHAYLLLCHWTV